MMSDETVAMSYVIKDDAEAENKQASIPNTRLTEGRDTANHSKSTAFQSYDCISQKYSVAKAVWWTAPPL